MRVKKSIIFLLIILLKPFAVKFLIFDNNFNNFTSVYLKKNTTSHPFAIYQSITNLLL